MRDGLTANVAPHRFEVNTVEWSQPLSWLRRGWEDLAHHRGASIAYGLLVTGIGVALLMFATTHVYFMAAAISGFMLFGPVMAIGLCDLSRRQARGEETRFDNSLDAIGRNPEALRHFALLLFALCLLWFVVSGLFLETVLGQPAPTMGEVLWGDVFSGVTPLLAAAYFIIGGVLAVIVFVLSVVSIPAILDHNINATDAMQLSARAASANVPAMLVWSGLIVLLTAIGFATFLVGMIIIYPLLGHATWYAYRDLIR